MGMDERRAAGKARRARRRTHRVFLNTAVNTNWFWELVCVYEVPIRSDRYLDA